VRCRLLCCTHARSLFARDASAKVEDIIWEVDEDCDGLIDWDNFVLMCAAQVLAAACCCLLLLLLLPPCALTLPARYYRCRIDKTGCEPKRLFTLAEFMMLGPPAPARGCICNRFGVLFVAAMKGRGVTLRLQIRQGRERHGERRRVHGDDVSCVTRVWRRVTVQ